MEYMILIGFVTIMTIPLIILYYTFIQESGDDINSAQIKQVAKKIVEASESVYYLGEPSQSVFRLKIPNGIMSSDLSNNELVFKMITKSGQSDIVENSPVNITGSLPIAEGIYTITVKSKQDHVEVSYK